MKILNLVNQESSQLKYKISKFPDGQQNITVSEHDTWKAGGIEKEEIQIKSRLNNFQDLELIICTTMSLRRLGVTNIHLYTPYILGCRSDRQFEEGSNNYLKDVICPILKSLNFDTITCIDPHSDVLEACLNNFKKESNLELVKFAHKDIVKNNFSLNPFILVSPDAGASKKIYKLAEQIGYRGEIITCSKDRDNDGKLTKVIVPINSIPNKDVIIIDDICDGGATFINIAKEIKKLMDDDAKLYLIVTHGIFSKGFSELSKYFDGIYCTNSYIKVFEHSKEVYEFNKGKMHYPIKGFVKQLDVFK